MPLEDLNRKAILERGSGAGRFSELLIDNCELLVSMDLSEAVDANLKNCTGKRPLRYVGLIASLAESFHPLVAIALIRYLI